MYGNSLLLFRLIGTRNRWQLISNSAQEEYYETEKISGPAFRNNEIDMIQIFKKENGKWKFWSQAILYIRYLD